MDALGTQIEMHGMLYGECMHSCTEYFDELEKERERDMIENYIGGM